jgi:DNA-binding XRE family transcriptional regulator
MTTASADEAGRVPAEVPDGVQTPPPRIVLPGPGPEIQAYSQRLNDCVRAELTRRRLALGKSPHALAVSGLIAKQTIVSIERGTHSPTVRTLAVLCQRLGTTVEAVIVAASRRDPLDGTASLLV